MKTKTLLFASFAFVAMGGLMCACSDDDDEDVAVDYAAEVVGTYYGDIYVALGDEVEATEEFKANTDPQKVVFSEEDGSLSLSLDGFSFNGVPMETTIELSGINVNKTADDSYTLSSVTSTGVKLAYGLITADITLNAEKSKIEGDQVVLYLDVLWVDEDTSIGVMFVGTK